MLLKPKNIYLICVVFMAITMSSCFPKFIAKAIPIFDKKIDLQVISNNEIVVCFIPMHHIGTKEFYDDVQLNIDTFTKQGFTVFYEGVNIDTSLPKLVQDTIYKKFRKITGLAISPKGGKGMIDTTNNTIMGLKANWIGKEKIINQPKTLIGSLDDKNLITVDLTIPQLVAQYELKYGAIVLEPMDYKTATNKSLGISATAYENKDKMILDLRDMHLAKQILTAKNNKLVIVYGKAHLPGVLYNLQRVDSSFKNLSVN